jgi:hypothetical protein
MPPGQGSLLSPTVFQPRKNDPTQEPSNQFESLGRGTVSTKHVSRSRTTRADAEGWDAEGWDRLVLFIFFLNLT